MDPSIFENEPVCTLTHNLRPMTAEGSTTHTTQRDPFHDNENDPPPCSIQSCPCRQEVQALKDDLERVNRERKADSLASEAAIQALK